MERPCKVQFYNKYRTGKLAAMFSSASSSRQRSPQTLTQVRAVIFIPCSVQWKLNILLQRCYTVSAG